MKSFSISLPAALCVLLPGLAQAVPVLTKLRDFNNNNGQTAPEPASVNDSPILYNKKLWFTSETGGHYGFGSLASYNIESGALTNVLSFDNDTGLTPKSSPVRDGDKFYITTIGNNRDGSAVFSTMFSYNIATGIVTPKLWEAADSKNSAIRTPSGGVAIIDRGPLGKDLYFNNYSGGNGTSTGAIVRYNTESNTSDVVYMMPTEATAPTGARQPFKGFTVVGTDLYFTTFGGGNVPLGVAGGTLCKLDASVRGAETVEVLASMPETSAQLPSHNPYYRALDNCLYFTTVGSNTQPGALMKYDLNTKTLTVLRRVAGATVINGTTYYLEGNKCYGTIVEWDKALYYTTVAGGQYVSGTSSGGTINRYDLRTGQHQTLFSLDGNRAVNASNPYDNFGGDIRGGAVYNEDPANPAFYFVTRGGGNFGPSSSSTAGYGTILKMTLDPVGPASIYESWSATYPALSATDRTPTADPDKDGRDNTNEFCFGTSPESGLDGNGYVANPTPSGLELRWTARTDGSVAYIPQSSGTLSSTAGSWTALGLTPVVVTPSDVSLPSGYERRKVVIPLNQARGFFRVQATLQSQARP